MRESLAPGRLLLDVVLAMELPLRRLVDPHSFVEIGLLAAATLPAVLAVCWMLFPSEQRLTARRLILRR